MPYNALFIGAVLDVNNVGVGTHLISKLYLQVGNGQGVWYRAVHHYHLH